MIASLISIICAGQFSLSLLDFEMSCDTYPYGVDASPVVQMRNGQRPIIDSLSSTNIWGRLDDTMFVWDSLGHCDKKPEHDLMFHKTFWRRE